MSIAFKLVDSKDVSMGVGRPSIYGEIIDVAATCPRDKVVAIEVQGGKREAFRTAVRTAAKNKGLKIKTRFSTDYKLLYIAKEGK